MSRLHTPIQRYDEFAAETINSRLRQLETGYDSVGNVSELINSNTLTSPILSGVPLSVSLEGIRWRWLRFTGAFFGVRSDAAAKQCLFRFNEDGSPLYDYQEFTITGTSSGGVATFLGNHFQFAYGALFPGHLDLLIWPEATGAVLLGSGAIKPDAGSMRSYRWSGRWRGISAATSFQIIPNSDDFATGSYWRLEGMRA